MCDVFHIRVCVRDCECYDIQKLLPISHQFKLLDIVVTDNGNVGNIVMRKT